ncbi:MAG: dihydrolipoyl dehydrogenase [Candidatus Aminicenantes bacterium]|nr:dihydrolipoyl dehydrogenase [Candidatus Aminicenantes bacterium]
MEIKKDIAIIGGGPGGYLAALRGTQLKRSVVLFEMDRVGGTCMNYGCIPTKYLLHQTKALKEIRENKNLAGSAAGAALDWPSVQAGRVSVVNRLVKGVKFLLEKGGVEIVKGRAVLKNENQVTVETPDGVKVYAASRIILAAGSRVASLPFLEPNGAEVVTSQEALEFPSVPKSLVVIGAGAIGLEIGSIYRRLGTDVTVLEILPGVMPGCDRESATRLERILKKQGLNVLTQMRIENALVEQGSVTVKGACLKNNVPFEYAAERVLLAAGRRPNSEGFSASPMFTLGRGGFVQVNSRLETNVPGIYAVGDLIGGKLLAHKAYHDAVVAVENACGMERTVDYAALPMAVFTDPEFASVGLTQEEAREQGVKVRSGLFPLQASGRALTMDALDGLVKVLADESDRVVGAHIIAPGASEMIAELTLAVAKKMKVRDIGSLIHIHPTLSEAVGEAALKAKGLALHLLN